MNPPESVPFAEIVSDAVAAVHVGSRGPDADRYLILFVQDHGIGIECRFHEREFGLFDKLNAGTEGTGIDLALARPTVEVHAVVFTLPGQSGSKG